LILNFNKIKIATWFLSLLKKLNHPIVYEDIVDFPLIFDDTALKIIPVYSMVCISVWVSAISAVLEATLTVCNRKWYLFMFDAVMLFF
jgi:hypothetical protein